MANEEEDGIKIIKFGKFTGVFFPEIYFKFVTTLMREHSDIVDAMVLAKLNIQDKSAIDYFNQILGTNVIKEMPMEVGYKILYAGLQRRAATKIMNKKFATVAKNSNIPIDFKYRSEEHSHKPLFPSIEEQEDRGDK